jgi:hypothetical protein
MVWGQHQLTQGLAKARIGRVNMLRTELFRSCSNAAIADVALRSMGCDFHSRIREIARRRDAEPGEFVAGLVAAFREEAHDGDLGRLDAVMSGSDMPLLSGFRFIVEDMLSRDAVPHAIAAAGGSFQHVNAAA